MTALLSPLQGFGSKQSFTRGRTVSFLTRYKDGEELIKHDPMTLFDSKKDVYKGQLKAKGRGVMNYFTTIYALPLLFKRAER